MGWINMFASLVVRYRSFVTRLSRLQPDTQSNLQRMFAMRKAFPLVSVCDTQRLAQLCLIQMHNVLYRLLLLSLCTKTTWLGSVTFGLRTKTTWLVTFGFTGGRKLRFPEWKMCAWPAIQPPTPLNYVALQSCFGAHCISSRCDKMAVFDIPRMRTGWLNLLNRRELRQSSRRTSEKTQKTFSP